MGSAMVEGSTSETMVSVVLVPSERVWSEAEGVEPEAEGVWPRAEGVEPKVKGVELREEPLSTMVAWTNDVIKYQLVKEKG